MDLKLSTCFVLVNDPDAALTFYRDVLGLELRNDVARDGSRWITVGSTAQPDVAIVLTNYVAGSPADLDIVAPTVDIEASILGAIVYDGNREDATQLAFVHPHGSWVDWVA